MKALELDYIATGIPAGTCVMTTMLGSEVEFLMSYEGYHFDQQWNVVETRGWKKNDPRWSTIRLPDQVDLILRKVGLFVIGPPPRKVNTFEMTWAEWTHKEKKGEKEKDSAEKKSAGLSEEMEIWVRKEPTRYFFLTRFQYAFSMKGVETSAGIKLDIEFSVFVIGRNPMTALVENNDWFSQLDELVAERTRNYVGGHHFFELLSEDPNVRQRLMDSHPLFKRLMKKDQPEDKKKRKRKGPLFGEYMTGIQMRDKRQTSTTKGNLVSLEIGLGVDVLDARIRSVSLPESERALADQLSGITLEEIAAERLDIKTRAEGKRIVDLAEKNAQAYNLDTTARKTRFVEVESEYLKTPGGVAVLIAGKGADALTAVGASVQANSNLSTVVFPSAQQPNLAIPLPSTPSEGSKGEKKDQEGS